MKLHDLIAVIVNWRTPGLTVRAAHALMADGLPARQIVIVENGSDDGSGERLREELPDCPIVVSEHNLGFGRAHNLAVGRHPGAGAYLLVNSDAFVHEPGSVGRLAAALDRPDVGIAVPRLLNQDLSLQRSVVPLSGPLSELVRASGLSRLVPNRLQPRLGTHWDHATSREIPSAIGAVLLIRGETWAELGGFDERRHMYAEEHDLFWRARKLGWRAWFQSDATFVHLGGSSSSLRWDRNERAEQIARADADMLRAHLNPWTYRLTIGLMAGGVGLRSVFFRLRGDRATASSQRAWLRGYLTEQRR